MSRRTPALIVAAAILTACGEAQDERAAVAAAASLKLVKVGDFEAPLYVTAPPGDRSRVVVVEQGGTIRVVKGGRTLARPFLDLRDRVSAGGERGLLSVAFAPDYARSGRLYVDYTDRRGDTRVVEYRRSARNPDRADPASARLVLTQRQPEANHNGGLLLFGPDRKLYVGLGDGGGGGDEHGVRGNGQDLSTWLGKILRIDPAASGGRPYTVPADNPFVGRAGAEPEIWLYGVRNPWRFTFDRANLIVADVGQNAVEEVTYLPRGGRGANLGWRPFEGRERFVAGERAPGHVPPQIELDHDDGYCSVTGGHVVRDRGLRGWRGRYVFGDFCDGRLLWSTLRARGASRPRPLGLAVEALSSFGEDASGRLYVTSLAGPVYRLARR